MDFQYRDMGLRIKARRKELKIKQAELAEVLDISNNHMSSIESGKQKPSLDTFINICNHLNTTPIIFCLDLYTHKISHKTLLISFYYVAHLT